MPGHSARTCSVRFLSDLQIVHDAGYPAHSVHYDPDCIALILRSVARNDRMLDADQSPSVRGWAN
jgi:hypothetical protein